MRVAPIILAGLACLCVMACKPSPAESAAQAPAAAPTSKDGFPLIIEDFIGFELVDTEEQHPPFIHGPVAIFADPAMDDKTRMIMATLQKDEVAPGIDVKELGRNVMMAGASGETKHEIVSQEADGDWTITHARATAPGDPTEGAIHEALKLTPGGYVVVVGIFDKAVDAEMVPRWQQFYRQIRVR